jgi:hypothetical protein
MLSYAPSPLALATASFPAAAAKGKGEATKDNINTYDFMMCCLPPKQDASYAHLHPLPKDLPTTPPTFQTPCKGMVGLVRYSPCCDEYSPATVHCMTLYTP